MKYPVKIYNKNDQLCGGFEIVAKDRRHIYLLAKEYALRYGAFSFSIGIPSRKINGGKWEKIYEQLSRKDYTGAFK